MKKNLFKDIQLQKTISHRSRDRKWTEIQWKEHTTTIDLISLFKLFPPPPFPFGYNENLKEMKKNIHRKAESFIKWKKRKTFIQVWNTNGIFMFYLNFISDNFLPQTPLQKTKRTFLKTVWPFNPLFSTFFIYLIMDARMYNTQKGRSYNLLKKKIFSKLFGKRSEMRQKCFLFFKKGLVFNERENYEVGGIEIYIQKRNLPN